MTPVAARSGWFRVSGVLALIAAACGSSDKSNGGQGGAGATSGMPGAGGSAGTMSTGGTAGTAVAAGGASGRGGAADRAGSTGSGAGKGGGAAGTSGSAGASAGSGTSGDAGTDGNAGGAPSAGLVPDDRVVDWTGNVGVKGGIPLRTTEIDCTQAPYGAHADGADTSAEIQGCIDGIAEGEVAFLPAGSYTLEDSLRLRSDKSLRGAGPGSTVLLFTADLDADVRIEGDYTDGTDGGIALVSGFDKGSTTVTLADASGFVVGDHIYLSELNDTTIPVTISNDNGDCNWCGIYGSNGDRARLQLAEVTAVAGDQVSIDPPLYFTFSAGNQPEALRAPKYVEYAGLESLAVVNDGDSYDAGRKPLELQGAANSWIKNVRVEKCGSRCIDLWFDVFRNEIRDSLVTGCFNREDSDNCYGLQIESGSANLVENVIFDGTADTVILVSASGNAMGYNLAHGVHRTADADTWFWPNSWTHGGHSSFNLWEGNDEAGLEWDYYWGSNSHNLAFRNRYRGMDPTITYDEANLQTNGAILTFPNNTYMSAVGNVLGTKGFHDVYDEREYEVVAKAIWTTPGDAFGTTSDKNFTTLFRHMNYDVVTDGVKHCDDDGEPGCQGSDASTALPASYYLGKKPAFFGNIAFPPVGPDVPGFETPIPAAACYEETVAAAMPFDAADCYE